MTATALPGAGAPATSGGAGALGSKRIGKSLHARRWRWIVWLLAVVAVAALGRRYLASRGAVLVPVKTHRVERGNVRDLVSTVAAGRVTSRREVVLRAEIAGTLRRLHHRRGEHVKAGETLFEYDPAELEDRLRVARAAASLAQAQAAQAAAAAAVAETNAKRARALCDVGAASPAEAENLDGQLEIATRAARAAEVAVRQGQANVELARTALGKSKVKAPFEGTVLTTSIEEGEISAPGMSLVALADMSDLYVEGELDEADLGKVSVGMAAEVSLDAFPNERIAGTLTEIAPSVTRDVRGNRSVAMRVGLPADPRLRVGMSADVDVIVATRKDVLWVPPNAVLGRGTDRAVYLVDGAIARRRPIEVGISTWESVEIARGVSLGDDVVVSLSSGDLKDGVRVEPSAEARGPAAREPSR